MFGIKYIQFDPTQYVLCYQKGKLKKEGTGLSFFYFAPTTSIAAVPVGSNDLPFIFSETTNDYQTVTIQGQITYKVQNPKQLSELLGFTVDGHGIYKKDDYEKLQQRIINAAQTATATFIHGLGLKETIRSGKEIEQKIQGGLTASESISMLGVEILGVNVIAVRATPEMEKAMETEAREKLQQEADQAIYERRNFAVEQERIIKETELNTQIAVEEKKKQIAEKKMESKVQEATNDQRLREMKVAADISVENNRKKLIDLKNENDRLEADTRGYTLEATLKPYQNMDWKLLMALSGEADAQTHIALAFRELADNADKIGNLNITPDLLQQLIRNEE
ncbi:SPFH domain-containing protein [Algivirga pacifica]|uniref:SPFH domain-containing protein n=1 Tax=Algivirga pacifica TaxID=1162670 RepID=A0ABP9DDA7_9BACT